MSFKDLFKAACFCAAVTVPLSAAATDPSIEPCTLDHRSSIPELARLAVSDLKEAHCALKSLGYRGPAAVPVLTDLLRYQADGGYVSGNAARALAQIGPAAGGATPAMIEMLERWGEDSFAAQSIIYALPWLGAQATAALPALRRRLSGEYNRGGAVTLALGVLGWYSPNEAVPELIDLLQDEDSAAKAAVALAYIGRPAKNALPGLYRLADSADSRYDCAVGFEYFPVRLRPYLSYKDNPYLIAIAAIDDPAASVPYLRRRLDGPGDPAAAATALRLLGPAAKPALPDLLRVYRFDRGSTSMAVRHAILDISANEAPGPRLLDIFVEAGAHGDALAADRALSQGPLPEKYLPLLGERLRSGGPEDTHSALRLLGAIPTEKSADVILDFLREARPALNGGTTARALAAIGEPGVRHLADHLRSGEAPQAPAVVTALCLVPSAKAREVCAGTYRNTLAQLRQALEGTAWRARVNRLVPSFGSDDRAEAIRGLRALALVDAEGVARILRRSQDHPDPGTRWRIREALEQIGNDP